MCRIRWSTRSDESTTTVNAGSRRVTVRVPEGTDLVIGSTSGRVGVVGRVGSVAVVTTSARVSVEVATPSTSERRAAASRWVRRRVLPGPDQEWSCAGRTLRHGPPDCVIGQDHRRGARADRHTRTVSRAGSTSRWSSAQDVDAETVSGRITVRLPHGVRPWVVRRSDTELGPERHDCVVTARSVSGRVDVVTA